MKAHVEVVEFIRNNDGTIEELDAAYDAMVRAAADVEQHGSGDDAAAAYDAMSAHLLDVLDAPRMIGAFG